LVEGVIYEGLKKAGPPRVGGGGGGERQEVLSSSTVKVMVTSRFRCTESSLGHLKEVLTF